MRTFPVLLVAASLAAWALPPDRTVWSSVKPTGSPASVKLVSAGKTFTYYAFDGEGASVRVKGPVRLRISVRAHFSAGETGKRALALDVSVDGAEPKTTRFECRRSKETTYAEGAAGEAPGGREEMILDLTEGEHTVRAKTDVKAWGSFAVPSRKKKILRTDMAPDSFERAVEEVSQERERTWYFGTQEKPVVLEVTGPTTLRVYAALNFDASMRTATDWKLEALLDGSVAAEKTWKSSRSHTRSYPDEKTLVPGQMESFDLPVPAGRHRIELKPSGSLSAAFRLLIPTSDVKKGGKK
ncbi:MAG: hypothetical protein IT452_09585 [Planctomycetia bacterium]|nr:hypothetical protein [Planctomycetia bacterium]